MRLKVVKKPKSEPKADKEPLRARRVRGDCPPGDYLVKFRSGGRTRKFGRLCLKLTFEIAEGIHAGQTLFGWVPIREDNAVNPGSKYYEIARLALDREPEDGEDLDPEIILAGKKIYVARCGYAKKKGKDYSDEYAKEKKDEDDFVRVHDLIEII